MDMGIQAQKIFFIRIIIIAFKISRNYTDTCELVKTKIKIDNCQYVTNILKEPDFWCAQRAYARCAHQKSEILLTFVKRWLWNFSRVLRVWILFNFLRGLHICKDRR
jgi:hypothetical protein